MSLKSILIIIILLIAVLLIFFSPKLIRIYKFMNLYQKDNIAENFISMDKLFNPGPMIKAADEPYTFKTQSFSLPQSYQFEGESKDLIEALDYFETDGLLVLKNDTILYEQYWHGNSKSSQHISYSVAKSFLSALIGIAYEDGLIDDLNDPIDKYLTDFNNSGYAGVPIVDLLQMSSGILFNEDYADPKSDINRFGRAIAGGTSMRDFAKTLQNEKPPGTYHHYVSIDTQMLAMLLVEVTGKSVSQNLQEHIWSKINTEYDAYYTLDDAGMEVALGMLSASLRDFAKFGLLYLNRGKWNGKTVVPESWVDASHTLEKDHLIPGDNPNSSDKWGYGYQWWIPGFPDTDYIASGIYNQYIYIDPLSRVVIAKTSSNYKFPQEKQFSKDSHVAIFRAIAAAVEAANLDV